jgi:hypothetical protein
MGDSIGHWVGNTLVVDTTTFNDSGGFYGVPAATSAGIGITTSSALPCSTLTLLYQFELDDQAFTQPWEAS